MKKIITKEKALDRLESLCSRSEQCESDLIRKLIGWGINASDRVQIIESLKENRFLDETRFAAGYSNDKARFSAWGPHRIRLELIKKRIPSGIISECLRNIDPSIWKEGLLKSALSKSKNLDLLGEEGRANANKLYRYLVYRGFPSSSATKAVNYIRKRQQKESDESVD